MFGLRNRDQLPPIVRDELENFVSTARGYLLTEHNDDGSHAAITATGNVTAVGNGTFAGQPRVYVKAAAATLTNGVDKILSWTTPAIDGASDGFPDNGWNVGSMFDATDPTRFRVHVTGNYLFTWSIQFTAGANGTRYSYLTTNSRYGTNIADLAQIRQPGNAASITTCTGFLMLPMFAEQYVTISAFQDSGGNLDLVTPASFQRSWFQMTKVG